jgi:hypothetical protein
MQQPREQLHVFVFFLGFGKTSRTLPILSSHTHYYTFLFFSFLSFLENDFAVGEIAPQF